MITAPQFNLTRMLDSGNIQPSAENQVQSLPQSFMDLVREAAREGNENRDMAETVRQNDARSQDTIPGSEERAVDDIGAPVLHESGQETEHQIEQTRGASHPEKNLGDAEHQHQMQEQGISGERHVREYDAASRTNKQAGGEDARGKKLDALRDADEMNGTLKQKNIRTADVQEHAQAVQEALRTVQEPSGQLREFERALKSFHEQFDGADSARKMQMMQELRARMKDVIGQMEARDDTSRHGTDANIATLRGRMKALHQSFEGRGQSQNGGERREESGNAPTGFKISPESHVSREPSNVNETRFEIGKQADVPARADVVSNASSRGSMHQMNLSTAQRVPFMNEQFELLMQQARITVRDARNGNFAMNLYPESLGRVNVNLGLEDGVLVGRFLVDSPEAREAMMESMDRLLAQLADAGIEVGAFQVNVRGERDRLVQNLQGYFAGNRRRSENEGSSEYDAHTVRTHDGLLDVIA